MFRYLLLIALALSLLSAIQAQDKTAANKAADKEKRKKIRSLNAKPRRAAIMSAIIPGLGQISNKQIWKAPIVWAGLGISGYLWYANNSAFKEFKNGYTALINHDTANFPPPNINGYSTIGRTPDQLARERDSYRYYRDLDMLVFLGIYALNIVDASVSAHLKDFDVNDNLSLNVKPLLYANINRQFTAGLTINLRFKK